jgi:hypothetical protein
MFLKILFWVSSGAGALYYAWTSFLTRETVSLEHPSDAAQLMIIAACAGVGVLCFYAATRTYHSERAKRLEQAEDKNYFWGNFLDTGSTLPANAHLDHVPTKKPMPPSQ